MKSLGMASTVPKARAGDFERALALLVALDSNKTKGYLAELVEAAAAHDAAHTAAEAAAEKAKKRARAAQEAEAAATVSRQALADQSEKSKAEIGRRETAVVAREAMATEVEAAQDTRDKELAEREAHLRKAGVKGF